jgi:signal transduction histidine kinase
MQSAGTPDDEDARLAKLHGYDILDTEAEASFDEITKLASTICGTPIALVSLIDKDRQWFKSRFGLEAAETHRDLAFCAHAILDPQRPLIVQDTLRDPRFSDNPLVTGDPNIRFYAGSPLLAPTGEALGTLCVIGRQPASLSAEQAEALRVLANQVVIQLELRAALKASIEKAKHIEESRRALDLTVAMLSSANAELDDFAYAAAHDLKAPLRVIGNAARWLEEDLSDDLTADMRENLRLIRGRVDRMNKLLDDLLHYARIGSVHDKSSSEIVAGDVLMENVLALVGSREGFTVSVGDGFSSLRVHRLPLQQILTNLIDNAIKHHDNTVGKVDVTVQRGDGHYLFSVRDDGPGIPPRFHDKIFKKFQTLKPRDQVEGSGMGLAFVRKIIDQYGQKIIVDSSEGRGSDFRFTWPIDDLGNNTNLRTT